MKREENTQNQATEVLVIGTGMGSLSAAALMAKQGIQPTIIEQNYLPGGCSSSYYRQGYIFESGATTLVGLDKHMPLSYILEETAIDFDKCLLSTPMQVHMKEGLCVTRHQQLQEWIQEAERAFGPHNQAAFWKFCYKISQFVWETSLKQQSFPPSNWKDFGPMILGANFKQFKFASWAFVSMDKLLKKFGLHKNKLFVDFVNEQLLITAQNTIEEVNALFGATALCYTNYGNYYVYGGLYQMVRVFCDYIESLGGAIHFRTALKKLSYKNKKYHAECNDGRVFIADKIVSGIPINNLLDCWQEERVHRRYKNRIMQSEQLNSAFQMGIGFNKDKENIPQVLHHQIHLDDPLPGIESKSIFLSFSHPDDWYRAPTDKMVASVSSHIPNPSESTNEGKERLEALVFETLEAKKLIKKEQVDYHHSSMASAWERWTMRKYGFVGGYPQFMGVKPWKMLDARIDGRGAYLCGDTAYPGQGIPGVCLSGIIAWKKMQLDG